MPNRVLMVFGWMNRAGAETNIMNIYRKIDRKRYQFDFVVHVKEKCDFDDEITALGGRIYHAPKFDGKNFIEYKRWWKSFLKKDTEHRLVHIHQFIVAGMIAKAARSTDKIIITTSHNTSNGRGVAGLYKSIIQRSIRNRSHYMIGCSDAAGEWLFGRENVKGSLYKTVYNVIELDKFTPERADTATMEELNLAGKRVYFSMGRFVKEKNHGFLLEVFRQIHKRAPESVLLIAGDGPLREEIERKIKRLGLEDVVLLLGIRDDIPKLLSCSDGFIFPSLFEGFPVSVIEAQAAGVRCFISDRITQEVGLSELVQYLPLKESAKYWAEEILKANTAHIDVKEGLRELGFDAVSSAKWWMDYYDTCVE